jgi:hypothetical protein
MIDFDWCTLGDVGDVPSHHIWHMVKPLSATTVCGEPVANPDEEWRWHGALGNGRPCDNCTEIEARKTDTGSP